MEIKFEPGTLATLHLAFTPLKKVAAQVVADMHAAGTGKRCGVCGKPFDAARKCRSVARLVHRGDLVMTVAWKLCGKCSHEARSNDGKVPNCLRREAESLFEAAHLMVAEAKGTA